MEFPVPYLEVRDRESARAPAVSFFMCGPAIPFGAERLLCGFQSRGVAVLPTIAARAYFIADGCCKLAKAALETECAEFPFGRKGSLHAVGKRASKGPTSFSVLHNQHS